MRKLLVLAAVLSSMLLAILVAAPAVPASGAHATRHVLVGDDLRFHPKRLRIHPGTRVVWRWGGGLMHNVTVIRGPARFHSATMTTGTYGHLFNRKGTYVLECTIHLFKMTVKVR